jgi:hypothetical protein
MFNLPRLAIAGLLAASLSGCGSLAMFEGFLSADNGLAKQKPATGKAYVFRGMGGRFASFEMDYLRDKIEASGIEAETYNHINWYGPAREAIARYKKNPQPIMAMGHSAGGDAALAFAWKLKEAGVPVSLIVAFDPTRKAPNVPEQRRPLHQHLSIAQFLRRRLCPRLVRFPRPFLDHRPEELLGSAARQHGQDPRPAGQDRGQGGADLHAAGPTRRTDGADPLYHAARRADRDCGIPASPSAPSPAIPCARSRSALRRPVWAVAQLNDLSPNMRFEGGRRLIIPRHLEAAAFEPPLASYAPVRN